jgi:hypothetical protein
MKERCLSAAVVGLRMLLGRAGCVGGVLENGVAIVRRGGLILLGALLGLEVPFSHAAE